MKQLFALLVTLFISCIANSQHMPTRIDKVQTKKDVETLMRSFDKSYEKFTSKAISEFTDRRIGQSNCKPLADSLQITEAFYKSDFDQNGLTDLLAIGDYYGFSLFVVMSHPKDSLQLIRLTRHAFQDCTFPKIINDTLIRYYYLSGKWDVKNRKNIIEQKDLVFKFGDFIELNPSPQNYHIQKIELQTTPCFGTCPLFTMTITADRKAIFNAERYNRPTREAKEMEGTFTTTIDEKSFLDLLALVNYSGFPKLEDNYNVPWTDDQTVVLRITYGNGQVKQIRDYGMMGTYALDRIYQFMYDLRFSQDWKSKPKD